MYYRLYKNYIYIIFRKSFLSIRAEVLFMGHICGYNEVNIKKGSGQISIYMRLSAYDLTEQTEINFLFIR